jgi:hypothetical protein
MKNRPNRHLEARERVWRGGMKKGRGEVRAKNGTINITPLQKWQ